MEANHYVENGSVKIFLSRLWPCTSASCVGTVHTSFHLRHCRFSIQCFHNKDEDIEIESELDITHISARRLTANDLSCCNSGDVSNEHFSSCMPKL